MAASRAVETSDLRSTAREHNRDSAQRHKWALGAIEVHSRPGNPRPMRHNDDISSLDRRSDKAALDKIKHGTRAGHVRKLDMMEGTAAAALSESSDSSSEIDDQTTSPAPDASVMYSFDAAKGPSQGSQILNLALAKAEERFKDKETVRLVKTEYDVLDAEGDTVGIQPGKKSKRKAKPGSTKSQAADDEEYEFV
ncbi:hypothetical protein K431DRAFT_292879 [Polychaeton citri CBS 116435]|uniref:Uncharacterized protein n=1 Tax=Polychaeton citri CBS 116435 TaxID=1314669 RepID=A0A9P4UP78_9PEZI|nr:hypothetical protein K431DRAFT_292879 [Polychaeton citri CBS 116435]